MNEADKKKLKRSIELLQALLEGKKLEYSGRSVGPADAMALCLTLSAEVIVKEEPAQSKPPAPVGWEHTGVFDVPTEENCDGWFDPIAYGTVWDWDTSLSGASSEVDNGKRWLLRKKPVPHRAASLGWTDLDTFDIPTKENCDGWAHPGGYTVNEGVDNIDPKAKRWLFRKQPAVACEMCGHMLQRHTTRVPATEPLHSCMEPKCNCTGFVYPKCPPFDPSKHSGYEPTGEQLVPTKENCDAWVGDCGRALDWPTYQYRAASAYRGIRTLLRKKKEAAPPEKPEQDLSCSRCGSPLSEHKIFCCDSVLRIYGECSGYLSPEAYPKKRDAPEG